MKKYVIIPIVTLMTVSRTADASYLSSQWKNLNAFIAPCELSVSGTTAASQCATWCKNQYPSWVDNSSINFVTSAECAKYGLKSTFGTTYCCVNNAVIIMYNTNTATGCLCPGENRQTVSGDNAISKTKIENKLYSFQCNDYKCFCKDGYYGMTKKLSQSSASDTCTKCPDMPSNNYGYNGAVIHGQTFNNTINIPDSNAPTPSDITACNISMNCNLSPYCDRYDETGQWGFTSACFYTK